MGAGETCANIGKVGVDISNPHCDDDTESQHWADAFASVPHSFPAMVEQCVRKASGVRDESGCR